MPRKDPVARAAYLKAYAAKNRELNNELQRKWLKANPERAKERRRKQNLATFGLTVEGYQSLFNDQHGVCAICLQPPGDKALCVDHCHATGAVRGLLCSKCNSAIGLLKEDPDTIRRAAFYLETTP